MAPPRKSRNRTAEFENLVEPVPQDFDPEAEEPPDNDTSGDELDDDGGAEAAREHYVDVGKSKLRKPKSGALGPQYRGKSVSRAAMSEDDDEDDPFSKDFDDDESDGQDEDESEGESEDESEDDGEDESEDEALSDDAEEDASDGETPETDFGDGVDAGPQADKTSLGDSNTELRDMMRDEQRAVAATLSQASKADAEKGRAVKRQRTAFDSLLGTRMKLQKALIGVNTLAGLPQADVDNQRRDASEAMEAAEAAAFNLWSTLTSFRDEVMAAKTGHKRKRPSFTLSTPTEDLWKHMQSQEADSVDSRNATLSKWSAKTRGATAALQRGQLAGSEPQSTVLDVIREQLSNPERLIKRAQTPRSCAPLQLSQRIDFDPAIYDDADFYGLMLKELLEQKSHDSVATSNLDVSFQMRRDAKTKKNVDTKASKGRKLRYTVHEKLQNFMAPEDRSTWGERQRDELFGSLFGQRLGLGEENEDQEDEKMGDDVDREEAGLMLFRS